MTIPHSIAVLSDIHGNQWALEAVLADIRQRGIERIVNLGDVLYGPLDPRGTADLLMPLEIPTVCGNEDRLVFTEVDDKLSPTLQYVCNELQDCQEIWLRGLPQTAVIEEMLFLCHASPSSDSNYLLWDVHPTGAVRRTPADVLRVVSDVDQPVILCGHDHVPHSVRLPSGQLVVNPGSVGLPAYADDRPYPHVMETGTPHARYAILHKTGNTWEARHFMVSYDWETAARCAVRNGRADWASWLQTGKAK